MDTSLTTADRLRLFLRIVLFPPAMVALLHWPAGDWQWRDGWLVIGALLLLSLAALGWMVRVHPALLRERLKGTFQEAQTGRDAVIAVVVSISMMLMFPAAALDYRFQIFTLGAGYKVTGWVLLCVSVWLHHRVVETNAFLSRSVVVQDHQQVVDTGPYGLVRHPMYLGVLLMVTGIAMTLGSVMAQLVNVVTILGLYARACSEESLLRRELTGYEEYTTRVRSRLIPYLF